VTVQRCTSRLCTGASAFAVATSFHLPKHEKGHPLRREWQAIEQTLVLLLRPPGVASEQSQPTARTR